MLVASQVSEILGCYAQIQEWGVKDAEQLEHSYTAGRNVKWDNYFGKILAASLKS